MVPDSPGHPKHLDEKPGAVVAKSPSLVVVRWNDAWVKAEENITLEDVRLSHAPLVVETIGWLLHEDEVGASIANEKYDGYFRGRTFIYRPMIISITPYNLTKKARHARKPAPLSPPDAVPTNA